MLILVINNNAYVIATFGDAFGQREGIADVSAAVGCKGCQVTVSTGKGTGLQHRIAGRHHGVIRQHNLVTDARATGKINGTLIGDGETHRKGALKANHIRA